MPAISPAATVTAPSAIGIARLAAGKTIQAATNRTIAVAIAKPLKTARPTGAEWSAEKVIMTAATAAKNARASCRWRCSNARVVVGWGTATS